MKTFPLVRLRCASVNCFALAVTLISVALITGCTNLNAVRDFAKEAAALGDYRPVPADFVETNVRMQALYGREASADQLAPIKSYRKLFEQRQVVLVKYMGALASLAEDDLLSCKSNLDQVASAATAADVLEKADANLFASAANLTLKIATDGARRRLIHEIVGRCDQPVQRLTKALAETVEADYLESLKREQQAEDSLLLDVKASKDQGLSRLANYTMQEHRIALAQRMASAKAFAKALTKVAEGHARLAAHPGDFTTKEFIAEIKGYQDEIKNLHQQLKN